MTQLYVAGPMTGLPEFNYPAFQAAVEELDAVGFAVESPHAPGQVDGWEWSDYMRRGLQQLLTCDGVAVLPGWDASRGAMIEVNLACALGMPVRSVAQWVADLASR